MGLLEFDKLPINTLVGADWKTFKAVTADKTIDKGFRNKYYNHSDSRRVVGNRVDQDKGSRLFILLIRVKEQFFCLHAKHRK